MLHKPVPKKPLNMDTKHLRLRYNTWSARMVVPEAVRAVIGKRELVVTLQTGDLKLAQKRRNAALAKMHAEIDRAVRGLPKAPSVPSDVFVETAHALLAEVRAGRIDSAMAFDALSAVEEREKDAYERANGVDDEGHPVMPESVVNAIRLSHSIVAGHPVSLLSKELETYLSGVSPSITAGTLDVKVRQIGDFQKWIKGDIDVRSVTRQMASRYVSEELLTRGAAPATTKKCIHTLSAFWNWLELRASVESNVWTKLSSTVKVSKRGTAAVRRPWTDEELHSLLTKLEPGDVLVPLTVLAAFTGCRINELADVTVSNVTADTMKVSEGKTAAAVRLVPLSPHVRPLVAALAKASTDGFLIPGLLSGGVDGRRSHMVGKRFGKTIRRLGFKDSALVFHSLRGAFITKLRQAGVPKSTIQEIVGHEQEGVTFSVYAGRLEKAQLQEAVQKVSYGATVDSFAAKLAGTLSITTQSRRRVKRS